MARSKRNENVVKKPAIRNGQGHIAPESIEAIMDDWLRGKRIGELSTEYGISRDKLRELIDRHRPGLYDRLGRNANELLAENALVRAEAWKRFKASSDALMDETLTQLSEQEVDSVLEKARRKGTRHGKLIVIRETMTKIIRKSHGNPAWLALIQASLDFEAKIRGWYAPKRLEIEGEFRVAGIQPEDLDEQMVKRFLEAVARFKAKKLALEGDQGGQKNLTIDAGVSTGSAPSRKGK